MNPNKNIAQSGYTVKAGDKFNPFTGAALGANNAAGSVLYAPSGYQGGTNSAIPAAPTIKSSDLSGATPLSIPQQPSQTAATGLTSYLSGLSASADKQQATADAAAKNLSTSRDDIAGVITQLGLSGKRQNELYAEQGVDSAKKSADEYQSQLEAEQKSLLDAKDAILKDPTKTREGAINAYNETARQSASTQANIAIAQAATQRRYESAKGIADRQLQAELEPLKAELQVRQLYYQDNKEAYSKAEQRAFESGQKVLQAQYDDYKETATFKSNIALEAAKYGATPSQLADIGNATTKEAAIAAAGKTLGKPFELQLRAQNFTETMAKKSYDLAVSSAEASLRTESNKANQEALLKFSDTTEAKAVTALKGQVNQVNQTIVDNLGSEILDPKTGAINFANLTDEQIKKLASNDSFASLLANAEARAKNPEISKLADGGDLSAEASLQGIINQRVKSFTGKSNATTKNIKDAINTTNSVYKSRLSDADTMLKKYQKAYPSSPILYDYQRQFGVSIPNAVAEAQSNGYSNDQIITQLRRSPDVSLKIDQMLSVPGANSNTIINYFLNQ